MSLTQLLLLTAVILFTSTLCRSTIGFGDALIAMPLLTLVIDIREATPLVAIVGSTVSIYILAQDWRKIEFHDTWHLALASFVGIPFGLWFLKSAPVEWIKGVLGVVIILFALYNLLKFKPMRLGPNWVYFFGFTSGVLGGAYNAKGPPVVAYGTIQEWRPDEFRATLQGYFLLTNILILASHAFGGLWTAAVGRMYLSAFPFVVTAILLGNRLNKRIDPQRFRKILYIILIGLGILMFL